MAGRACVRYGNAAMAILHKFSIGFNRFLPTHTAMFMKILFIFCFLIDKNEFI